MEGVEESQVTVVQLMKSSVRSAIDNDLIDKVCGVVAILSDEHRLFLLAVEFLRLPEKLGALCDTLLNLNKDLQTERSKSEEKLMLEAKMKENLQITCPENIKQKVAD